jgi:FKBP-type peptidyl-prolyl cis-trans isomerase 2
MGLPLRRPEIEGSEMNDETLCIGAVAVVILMVGGLALLSWWDDRDKDDDKGEEMLLVQEGDEISVDYTGRFLGSNGELGAMFDTSIPEDARNESIPKAMTFQDKPAYDDMTFTVGSGQMIPGFDKGVLGMSIGSEKYITVPPEDGYGVASDDLIIDIPSIQSIPLNEEITREDFKREYPGIDPQQDSFIHPFWKWDVKVIDRDPVSLSIVHQPNYLDQYGNFPWNVTVTDISTSRNTIRIQHNQDEIDENALFDFPILLPIFPDFTVKAIEANDGQDPEPGRITSIGGVITVDFNREVSGKTLVFYVRVNSINRGE